MNNLENIFKLINAGYSKEEINELLNPAQEEAPVTNEAPVAEETPAQEKAPVSITSDMLDRLGDALNGLNERINKLDKSIKAGNIINDSMGAPKKESAEDILASLITPKLKEK